MLVPVLFEHALSARAKTQEPPTIALRPRNVRS
jgi:hypothetical protein